MSLIEQLTEEVIKVPLQSTEKSEILIEMATILKNQSCFDNLDEIVEALQAREDIGSTGLGMGIAIPHAKTTAVSTISVALGISPEGVDFEALDGQPSTIFFLILAPPEQAGAHVEALSEIAKITQSSEVLQSLIKAKTPTEIVSILKQN